MITDVHFKMGTGKWPIQDDLERCNCPKAGQIGHQFCGWSHVYDMPMAHLNMDQLAYHLKHVNKPRVRWNAQYQRYYTHSPSTEAIRLTNRLNSVNKLVWDRPITRGD